MHMPFGTGGFPEPSEIQKRQELSSIIYHPVKVVLEKDGPLVEGTIVAYLGERLLYDRMSKEESEGRIYKIRLGNWSQIERTIKEIEEHNLELISPLDYRVYLPNLDRRRKRRQASFPE